MNSGMIRDQPVPRRRVNRQRGPNHQREGATSIATDKTTTLTAGEMQALAERSIAGDNALVDWPAIQADMRLAARALRTLLQHTSVGDLFVIYADDNREGY